MSLNSSLEIVRRQTIVINSNKRQSGTIANCTFEFPITVSAQDKVEKVLAIPTLFVSRRSWPAVDDDNNSFRLITNPLPTTTDPVIIAPPPGYSATTITVPSGNYNTNTFLQALQLALPIDWFVQWDSVTNKYTFVPPNDDNNYGFRFPNYLCFQCGFPHDITTIYHLTHASPLTSTQPAQMTIESLLLVNTSLPIVSSANLDNFGRDGSIQDSTALIKVPVTMPFYDILEWRSHDVELQRKPLANQHITRMDISITDEYGRVLAMTSDWTLSIVIEYWAPTVLLDIAADMSLMRSYLHYLALSKIGTHPRHQHHHNQPHEQKNHVHIIT